MAAEPRRRRFPKVLATALTVVAAGACLPAQAPSDPDWALGPLLPQAPPACEDPAFAGHPVDRFVHAAATAQGVPFAPRADRRTLLRRASFVLTGLPPTPAEVAAFVADPDDHDTAWANVVDRLLASPHHGEHMARHWLDLARYSDSNGLDENLAFANAFRYRDWVVRAHQDDLPFDRFVVLQLAGDLLALDPTVGPDGTVATGFLALGPRMLAEQDKEKLVLDTVDEQLDLVGRTVLGLTLGCARCHDHKFDPISQRDYYALAGVFRSTTSFAELGHVSTWLDHELGTAAELAARRSALARRDAAVAELESAERQAHADSQQLLQTGSARLLLAALEQLPQTVAIEAEEASATSLHADDRTWGSPDCTVLHSHRPGEQFANYRFRLPAAGRYRLLARAAAAESRPLRVLVDDREFAAAALGETTGGWRPEHQQWREIGSQQFAEGEHTLRLVALGPHVPHLDALLWVPERTEPSDDAPLPAAWLAHAQAALHTHRNEPCLALLRDLATSPPPTFAGSLATAAERAPLVARLLGSLPPRDLRELVARSEPLIAAFDPAVKPGDPVLHSLHAACYGPGGLLAMPDAVRIAGLAEPVRQRLQQLATDKHAAEAAVPKAPPRAMCVADGAATDLPVHLRGNHLTLAADPVPRGAPAVFASFVPPPPMPERGSGRLELARWLFAPEQGLAARVHANRLWQRAFGQGLSRSPSNFGRRGDRPVQPALLEWLAHDLRTHGWSQKHLWRTILTSRTWQLAATADPRAVQADPEHRLHTHFVRQRLSAESLRDALLATAGTLDRRFGGSLLLTEDRGYVTNDQSGDAARYDSLRRSLYLPIVRNAMYDLFAAFDYADPSVHLEQRPQSTVATQALWLLNAPLVRQQSEHLARRTLDAATADAARLAWLWQQVLQRAPSAAELHLATTWLARPGERLAAYTDLVQALFVGNEFAFLD